MNIEGAAPPRDLSSPSGAINQNPKYDISLPLQLFNAMINNNNDIKIHLTAGGALVISIFIVLCFICYKWISGKDLNGEYELILAFKAPDDDTLAKIKMRMLYRLTLVQENDKLTGSGAKTEEVFIQNNHKKNKKLDMPISFQADLSKDTISSSLRFTATPDKNVISIIFHSDIKDTPLFIDAKFRDNDSGRSGSATFRRL